MPSSQLPSSQLSSSKLNVQVFKKLLLQSINNFKALSKLLEEEKAFLQQPSASPEGLEILTERKNKSLTLIQKDIDQRKLFLEELGFTADLEGIEGFLTSLSPSLEKSMRQGWKQLVSCLESVQKANAVNGRLINRATQHFDLLLSSFKTSPNKVKVYNPAGGSGNLNTLGSLGKA